MHFCGSGVSWFLDLETGTSLTLCSRYLSEMRLGGQSFLDGGILHNNPAAIARREGAKLWSCRPDENFLVSVGCGDMRMMSMGDNVVARLFKTLMYKTYPAKEEEVRALWGDYSDSYIRLDPKLDIDDISLDDVKSMLSLLSRVRCIIKDDQTLQGNISKCAWQLLANTFFCHDVQSSCHFNGLARSVTLCCRLGGDASKILEKWPDARLLVNGLTSPADVSNLPCTVQLDDNSMTAEIKIELVSGTKRASISGFPRKLGSLPCTRPFSEPEICVVKKRKHFAESTNS
jgi:hypothetical protein